MNVSEYFENDRINLTGGVNENMLEDLDRQVRQLTPGENQPATVILSSAGGSVGSARAIYEELVLLQKHADLNLVARGICLSAGITIAMAFPKERRFATPNTKFLIHEGSMDITPPINGPLSARVVQKDNYDSSFADDQEEYAWVMGLIAKGCEQPLRKVKKEARSGLWLVGKKAVEYGLVDSLLR